MRKKVTVVGAGNVGATAAMRIAEKELADVGQKYHERIVSHESTVR
jgi:malate/lactate dehydrogenase